MKFLFAILLLCLASGCASQRVYEEGVSLIDQGNAEAGLAKLQDATKLEPDNAKYRQAYFRERETVLQRYLAAAEGARRQGDVQAAEQAYTRMLALAPDNARAKAGLAAIGIDRRHRSEIAEAETLLKQGDTGRAAAKVRTVLGENPGNREAQQLLRRIEDRAIRAATAVPEISPVFRKPVTLEFRDAPIRQLFEVLSRDTGLNFLFDREVRQDLRTTIYVRNSSIEDVLRFILVTNQLERKVLSENTVLIYPNTPAKARDYQELVTKSFYLANADAKAVATMLKALVKTKDLHFDEKLNLVVLRDTPDAIRMAERLVANHDLAEPEVMLEVEVLEVSSNVLEELGIRYPDQVSWSAVGAAGTAGSVTLPEWLNRSSGLVRLAFTNPLLALNFRNSVGRTNLLANPRIRVKNKDKAKVHIGDKVPVITTTTTTTGFASESVTYLDVGLKLDVEPTVFLEDDVGIKVGLEVSNIVREIKSSTGTLTYQVGTRNAATTLRLKDGETQILAGLISDEDRKTANQIPGLGNIPVVGRLFGSHQDTSNKTEIVLLITPRVLRNLSRPEVRYEEFVSGTEAAIGARPLSLSSSVQAPVAPAAPAPIASSPAAPPSAGAPRISLKSSGEVIAGHEITVVVSIESEGAIRRGLLDFAFDASRLRFVRAEAGALAVAADRDAVLRASAPEGGGRVSLSYHSNADLQGSGEFLRLTFQAIGSGTPNVRLEAITFRNSSGEIVRSQLPSPLTLSPSR